MKELLQMLTGVDPEELNRRIQLKRNPEGLGDTKYCPVCKKPVYTNEQGDTMCTNFSLGYKENGKCLWHRWKDGTNYWSDPMEVITAMAKDDPAIDKLLQQYKKENL